MNPFDSPQDWLKRGILPPVPNGDLDLVVAACLGGPLAMGWLMAENLRVLEEPVAARAVLMYRGLLCVGILALAALAYTDMAIILWFCGGFTFEEGTKDFNYHHPRFAHALSPRRLHLRTFVRFCWVLPSLWLGLRLLIGLGGWLGAT